MPGVSARPVRPCAGAPPRHGSLGAPAHRDRNFPRAPGTGDLALVRGVPFGDASVTHSSRRSVPGGRSAGRRPGVRLLLVTALAVALVLGAVAAPPVRTEGDRFGVSPGAAEV